MVDAYSIFQSNGTDEAKLREVIASIEDSIMAELVSANLKNTNLSGDPMAGSVKVSRLMGATVRDYGTARTAGAGDKVKDNYKTVSVDQRKEIVEEINRFDIAQYGLADMIARRKDSIVLSFMNHIDEAFFAEAESAGTEVTTVGTTIADRVEYLIQSAETVKNSNVHGVKRNQLALSLTPEAFGKLANYIDTLPNPVDGGVDVNYFHKVKVYSNVNQTEDAIVMYIGAIAEPVVITDVRQDPIPMSNEDAISFFFNYGVEAITPDLIFYGSVVDDSEVSA